MQWTDDEIAAQMYATLDRTAAGKVHAAIIIAKRIRDDMEAEVDLYQTCFNSAVQAMNEIIDATEEYMLTMEDTPEAVRAEFSKIRAHLNSEVQAAETGNAAPNE